MGVFFFVFMSMTGNKNECPFLFGDKDGCPFLVFFQLFIKKDKRQEIKMGVLFFFHLPRACSRIAVHRTLVLQLVIALRQDKVVYKASSPRVS